VGGLKWRLRFLEDGCGCSRGANGGYCSQYFQEEAVLSNLNNCLEPSSGELDLVILASIQVFTRINIIGKKRKRNARCSFLYLNCPMCKEMFLNLYGISYSCFRILKEHYEEHGICQRVHGNSKILPHNTLPQAVTANFRTLLRRDRFRSVMENNYCRFYSVKSFWCPFLSFVKFWKQKWRSV